MKIKRKKLSASSKTTYTLEFPDGTHINKDFPQDGDGVALSWAVGVLCFSKGDGKGKYAREGEEVPEGDYLLTLRGDVVHEPKFALRKHPHKSGQPLVSWGEPS